MGLCGLDIYIKTILCSLLVLFVCIANADVTLAQTFIIDDFDKEPTHIGKKYPSFIATQRGYDIYYKDAEVQLSHVQISKKNTYNKALRINFSLPPAYSWGNWLSIRREYKPIINLDGYKGLELNLLVEVPAPDAMLRITLSDLTDVVKDGDEMWWFDCDLSLLGDKTQQWIRIFLPFDRFYISGGAGTRHNDYKKNFKKIAAYEINLVSKAGTYPKGVILLGSLHAYEEQLILFDFDLSIIKPENHIILDEYVRRLNQNPKMNIEIQGHTDNIGSSEYNQLLSERRAREVMHYFLNKGIARQRIQMVGYSYSIPIAPNKTVDGRTQNRRVNLLPN